MKNEDHVENSEKHKRFSTAELLEGATPEVFQALINETAWALNELSIGNELT